MRRLVQDTAHPTLHALRARWASAVAEDDWRTCSQMLLDGATFASFSIRTGTDIAEETFRLWADSGRPDEVPTWDGSANYLAVARNARLRASLTLFAEPFNVRRIMTLPPIVAENYLIRSLRAEMDKQGGRGIAGFGPPKASFALACAGKGWLGCIDSRLLKSREEELRPFCTGSGPRWYQSRRKDKWEIYLKALGTLWPDTLDTADHQWCEWDTTGQAHQMLLD